jgi:hypothetical protein
MGTKMKSTVVPNKLVDSYNFFILEVLKRGLTRCRNSRGRFTIAAGARSWLPARLSSYVPK